MPVNAWESAFAQKNSASNYKSLLRDARRGGGFEPNTESGGVARYATTVGGRRKRNKKTRRRMSRRSRR